MKSPQADCHITSWIFLSPTKKKAGIDNPLFKLTVAVETDLIDDTHNLDDGITEKIMQRRNTIPIRYFS